MKFLFLRSLKTYTTLLFTGALLFTTGCEDDAHDDHEDCLLYTSPSPRDGLLSRMPSSA